MNNQQLAFQKLSKLKVGALFMEMGSGKTKIALDLINSKQDKVNYILWVCPFSIKQEIKQEINKWYPNLEIDIVGVETISMSDNTYLKILDNVKSKKTFMIVDESLKIKNIEAKRTKRILHMGSFAIYKLILNGTPISKNYLDLWAQMEFLSPKILKMSYTEFKNTFCEYYIRGKLKGLVKKHHNVNHLIKKIEPYIFDSKLDLDINKNYYEYTYALQNQEEYNKIKRDFLFSGDDVNNDFMALSQLLQKFYTAQNNKNSLLKELLANISGQCIIFVKFLQNIPSNSARITGEMTAKERDDIITKFKNNQIQHLYITYGCGSFGLNLQNCHNIIFADNTFDYAQRIQAEHRIFRLGQQEEVNYYTLKCSCGLDNMICSSLDKKSNLLTEIKKAIEDSSLESVVNKL